MANIVKCPECGRALKLGDEAAGKRVRCPACKHAFTVPTPEEEIEEIEEIEEEAEPEPEERPSKRSRRPPREDEEEEEPPRRRRASRDEDEEEEEEEDRPRPRKKKKKKARQVSAPSGPLVWAIIACFCSCAPLIGFICGYLAMSKADAAMSDLPDGERSDSAYRQLQMARIIGIVGMCLSAVWLVVGLILRVTGKLN